VYGVHVYTPEGGLLMKLQAYQDALGVKSMGGWVGWWGDLARHHAEAGRLD
jgi:hypothetical protein